MWNEVGWNALLGFVGIDNSPDEFVEGGWAEIMWRSIDAFFYKQQTRPFPIPDDCLPFRKASAQHIIHPDALPFPHNACIGTNLMNRKGNSPMPGCPAMIAPGVTSSASEVPSLIVSK